MPWYKIAALIALITRAGRRSDPWQSAKSAKRNIIGDGIATKSRPARMCICVCVVRVCVRWKFFYCAQRNLIMPLYMTRWAKWMNANNRVHWPRIQNTQTIDVEFIITLMSWDVILRMLKPDAVLNISYLYNCTTLYLPPMKEANNLKKKVFFPSSMLPPTTVVRHCFSSIFLFCFGLGDAVVQSKSHANPHP